MRLDSIELYNYRCFKTLKVTLDKQLTLFVGKNGAGKSAVLDAIAVAVSTFLCGIEGSSSRSIQKDDSRYEFHDLDGTIDAQHQFPVIITGYGMCNGEESIKWTRSLNTAAGKTTVKDAHELTAIVEKMQKRIMEGDKNLILPILSYYGTGRLYAQKKEKRNLQALQKFNRQVGYVDCMDAESNEKLMLNWFESMTYKSLQTQQKTGSLEKSALLQVVEAAICHSFERISGAEDASMFFDLDTHRIIMEYSVDEQQKERFALDEMSDGYKNTLSMIGDIAYRMAVLNPQLGTEALTKTPGIVLVDEIDLHLHPQWQQTILEDLQNIFPKVQFIVTSHAPTVINSVIRERVRILDNHQIYIPAEQTFGRDANSIMREVMDVGERPIKIKKQLEEFYRTIDAGEISIAENLLNEIEKEIGSSDPEINSARVSLSFEKMRGEFE